MRQSGSSLARIKCAGDYLSIAYGLLKISDTSFKTGVTSARIAAGGGASSIKVFGVGLDADKAVAPLWDWVVEVVGKWLAWVSQYLGPLAFFFGVLLPALPYTVFIIVVTGWLLAVLQAVVAAPLWALMFMTPENSFVGSQKQGAFAAFGHVYAPGVGGDRFVCLGVNGRSGGGLYGEGLFFHVCGCDHLLGRLQLDCRFYHLLLVVGGVWHDSVVHLLHALWPAADFAGPRAALDWRGHQ